MRHTKIITPKCYSRKKTKTKANRLAKQTKQTNQPGNRLQAARTRNRRNTQAATEKEKQQGLTQQT
jgi:hypothetical protein